MNELLDDNALVSRVARRDTQAYRLLVKKYLPYCIRFAERMTGNRQDAEDIAQDVCFKIWTEADKWKPENAQFSTWLYRVLYNRCIDYRRKVIPFAPVNLEEYADAEKSSEDIVIERQQADRVKIALKSLSERQRAAIILSYYEEIQGREAAKILDISYDYFYQLLSQARQVLRHSLSLSEMEKKNER